MIMLICVWICLANFIVKAVSLKPLITTPTAFGYLKDGVEDGGIGYSSQRHRFSLQQGSLRNKPDNTDFQGIPFVGLKADSYGFGDAKEDIYPIEESKLAVYPWEKYCCDYVNDNMVETERAADETTDGNKQYGDERKREVPFNENPLKPLWFNSYITRNHNRETSNFFPVEERLPDIATPPTYTKPLVENNYRQRFLSKVNVNLKTLADKQHSSVPSISSKSSNAKVNKFDSEVDSNNNKNIYNNNNNNNNNNDALLTDDSDDGVIKLKFMTRKRLRTRNLDRTLISQDTIKFPEKEIVSNVYDMIEKANSLHQLDNDDDAKNILEAFDQIESAANIGVSETIEPLPEAQRRYADERTEFSIHPSDEVGKWDFKSVHFTTVSIGTLMIFLILVVTVLALRVHCRNSEKTAQEWIRHPVVQPTTAASDAIQPNLKHILHPDHLHTEPIRIKAKGLLERRGSNTSLTIDLGPGSERADGLFSPSRECTPEDFLMTAGSRMSRRQLRNCLKDPRDLHAEFWQIPTNHPDKCGVPGAAAKNRYRTVLPNEESRVVLHKAPPDSPETPASQYINANYIRGYEGEERAYVATQGPLAHTIEDLWLLVLQERSPAIVMITRLKEKGRVKCEPYIPSYSATYGSINVTVKQVIQKNGYTIRQIYVKRGDEVHTTLHFWFTSWPDHKAPSSARHLLAMASEVEQARKMQLEFFSPNHKRSIFSNQESRGPVVVHCSAGIGRTGCFIGVSIGRIQLLEEDCVDVLSIVCQMRLDRGGMVQTAEQYEFIHRALALYEASLPMTASAE